MANCNEVPVTTHLIGIGATLCGTEFTQSTEAAQYKWYLRYGKTSPGLTDMCNECLEILPLFALSGTSLVDNTDSVSAVERMIDKALNFGANYGMTLSTAVKYNFSTEELAELRRTYRETYPSKW